MLKRNKRIVKIGNKAIGGSNNILIQSMTNTRTKDIVNTIKQILDLEKVGCDIIRVAVLDEEDALAISVIKKSIHIPIVADIHFDYKLALLAVDNGADKLRINPGNIGDIDCISKVVTKCLHYNIPIRIGVNSGSLEKDLLEKYGHPTPEALCESIERHIKILNSLDFNNIVLSIKTSNINTSIESYRILNEKYDYPLHIGITEAGTKFSGSIKSSIGLGILINENIGDTIRVSLTSDPIDEVITAKEILSSLDLYTKPELISCPTCGRTQYDMLPIANEIQDFINTLPNVKIKIAIMGCVVNGPGEAKEADIGIAGGKNCAVLFKKGIIIRKIEEKDIIKELKNEIKNMITEM